MRAETTCALCGQVDWAVMPAALVHWAGRRQPEWDSVSRCRDKVACRARLEAKGETWPLIEGSSYAKAEPA